MAAVNPTEPDLSTGTDIVTAKATESTSSTKKATEKVASKSIAEAAKSVPIAIKRESTMTEATKPIVSPTTQPPLTPTRIISTKAEKTPEAQTPSPPPVQKSATATTPQKSVTAGIATETEKLDLPLEVTTVATADTAGEAAPPPYSPPPVYIAVIGQTGAGKTTFISEVTGKDLVIGHRLDSCTQDVQEVETTINGRIVNLIDTPGFNDSRHSDSVVLETIGTYLKVAYAKRVRLTGVIYLQWIYEKRMQGTAIRNLRLLKDLCGSENYGNIVLVTLGWSHPPSAQDEIRETELRTTDRFWGEFIKQGATIRRHHGGKESAIEIVKHLLDKTPVVLKFQKELAKVGIIGKTSAGEEVILNLAKDKEADQKMIEMLQIELKTATEEKSNLQAQIKNLQDDLDLMSKQIEKLNTSLAQRLEEDARLRELGGDDQKGDRPFCSVQ